MFFTRTGQVNACGWNKGHPMGFYPNQSIQEIWESSAAEELRHKLKIGDFSAGCKLCEQYLKAGNIANAKSQHYNSLFGHPEHDRPLRMDFALSNRCNVECQTCYGELTSSIRKNREGLSPYKNVYDEAFVEQLKPFIPFLKTATFMGGEPFLIDIYYQIWNEFARISSPADLSVTTNATVLNDKVKGVLDQGRFNITVSRDCMDSGKLERIRKNTNGKKQFENIEYFSSYAQRHNREFGLSAIFSTLNWDDLPEIAKYCNQIGAKLYVCMVMFPFNYSVMKLTEMELKEIESFYEKHLAAMPSLSDLEKKNKSALGGVLNHIKWAIGQIKVNSKVVSETEINLDSLQQRMMKKVLESARESGANEQTVSLKFESALKQIKTKDVESYEQILRNSQGWNFDMVISHVLWQDENHITDYLPQYMKVK